MRRENHLYALSLVLAIAGCSKKESPPAEAVTATASASVAKPAGGAPSWTDPPEWKKNPPSNAMRVAEYVIPRKTGDTEDAECVVTTFGPGQGGTVDANIDRWVRQFDPKTAKVEQKTARDVGGMHVSVVEITGAYKGMAMPGAAPTAAVAKSAYRMIGAVVESPKGVYFFKITGPDGTVHDAGPAFDRLIDSLKIS